MALADVLWERAGDAAVEVANAAAADADIHSSGCVLIASPSPYFFSFSFIMSIILINLFVAIILQGFDEMT